MAAHLVGVLGEAVKELLEVGRLAVLLSEKEFTEDQGQHRPGVGTQGGMAGQVVLDARSFAAPPALPLVLQKEHC
jgi:hypothetical protein